MNFLFPHTLSWVTFFTKEILSDDALVVSMTLSMLCLRSSWGLSPPVDSFCFPRLPCEPGSEMTRQQKPQSSGPRLTLFQHKAGRGRPLGAHLLSVCWEPQRLCACQPGVSSSLLVSRSSALALSIGFCFMLWCFVLFFNFYSSVLVSVIQQHEWVSEWKPLGRVWLLATPWTVQSTVSRLDTGVGSLALLQWIFPTQGWSSGLPHCRWVFIIWAAGEAQDKVNQPEPHVHPLPPASLPPHPAPVPARIITDASLGSCAGAASHQRWAHP